MRQEWTLFVDETGPIHDATVDASLVGVLVEGRCAELRPVLANLVAAAFAGFVYPPHATELRRSSGVLRSLLLGGSTDGVVGLARSTLDEAFIEMVKGPEHRRARGVLEARLNETALASIARSRAKRATAAFKMGLATLTGNRALLWTAASVPPARAEGDPEGPDRYDAALETLFERLFLLFRGGESAHRIEVLAATLRRREPALGNVERPLMHTDIGRAARRALDVPFHNGRENEPLEARVRVVPLQPLPYDENVHPGLVLADFVANNLHRALGTAGSMRSLLEEGRTRTSLSGERLAAALPGQGPLPAAAAIGAPRAHVRQALEGEVDALSPSFPAWRVEQATRWAAALREVLR